MPRRPRYQLIHVFPHNAARKIPTDRYGPIASTRPAPLILMRITWTTEPIIHPSRNARMISFHPRISPQDAISFTSPPPIALPPLTRNRISSRALTQIRPIRCEVIFPLSSHVAAIPRINRNTLIPNGIS